MLGDPIHEPLFAAAFHASMEVIKNVGGRMVTRERGDGPGSSSLSDELLGWFRGRPIPLMIIAQSMVQGPTCALQPLSSLCSNKLHACGMLS